MKKLQVVFLVNCVGLLLIFLSYLTFPKSSPAISTALVNEEEIKNLLTGYSLEDLQVMIHAGEEVLKWEALLAKTGSHIVKEVLKGQGFFTTYDHFPIDDTFDEETYAQYYYHAHRPEEHGHFHLFLRGGGMDTDQEIDPIDTYAHLIAISMTPEGKAQALFTTNPWVTGEEEFSASELKKMLPAFQVRHAHPSYVVNQWMQSMVQLFRPQIELLIDQKERALLESPLLEITSESPISIETQLSLLKREESLR